MYDPLLGRTYAEIGADARSNHKCQGMTGLPALPGIAGGRGGPNITWLPAHGEHHRRDKWERTRRRSLKASIRVSPRWRSLPARIRPPRLTAGIAAIVMEAKRAQNAFDGGNDAGTAAPVEAGLAAVRALRAQLAVAFHLLTRRGMRSISVSRSRSAIMRTPSSSRMA